MIFDYMQLVGGVRGQCNTITPPLDSWTHPPNPADLFITLIVLMALLVHSHERESTLETTKYCNDI